MPESPKEKETALQKEAIALGYEDIVLGNEAIALGYEASYLRVPSLAYSQPFPTRNKK